METTSKSKFVKIGDEGFGHSVDNFNIPTFYKEDLDSVLIPEGMVVDRVKQLCVEINDSLGDAPVSVLCVLKGSFKFFTVFSDHLSQLRSRGSHPILYDFIRLQSYSDTKSTGSVQVLGANPLASLKGRHVLVVEDLLDTGLTMKHLLELLGRHEPKTIRVVTLLKKRNPSGTGYVPDFIGFEIPNLFIVGFGMDFNEYYRDLHHICVIGEKGIAKYGKKQNGSTT